MTGICLLILIISSGYAYNHFHPERKFQLYRSDGQHLYFSSALTGLILFGISTIIFFSLFLKYPEISNSNICDIKKLYNFFYIFENCNITFPQKLNLLFSDKNYISNLIILSIIVFIEILFSIYLYKILIKINNLSSTKKSLDLVILEKFPIEKLLYISSNDNTQENKIVMITFSDRKVYIGTVDRNPNLLQNFSENHNIFKFIPFYSGYRNKDTLDGLCCTNLASKAYSAI